MWADGNSVTITNTTLSGDTAAGGSGGTAGQAAKLTTAVVGARAALALGEGGGLLLLAGTATVSDCTIANVNASANSGGGIAIVGGTATVNNTILGTNTGGDIVSSLAFSGAVTSGSKLVTPTLASGCFVGQTVTASTASTGSVIPPGTTIQAIDPNSGAITLSNAATSTGQVTLQVSGTLTGGYNLISDSTYQIAGLTNTVNADPQLGNLANNGGPTQTMAMPGRQPRHRRGQLRLPRRRRGPDRHRECTGRHIHARLRWSIDWIAG